jgi:two-component system, NtrC family, sensor kinase
MPASRQTRGGVPRAVEETEPRGAAGPGGTAAGTPGPSSHPHRVAAESWADDGVGDAPAPVEVPRGRLTTGRRLLLAFSVVVSAFALAVLAAYLGIRRVERVLDKVDAREQRMTLALQLEDALRDQYALQAGLIAGERGPLRKHLMARGQVAELARRLALDVDASDRHPLGEVGRAVEEFDRIDEQVAQAAAGGISPDRAGLLTAAHERAFTLVTLIDVRLDGLLERQHAALVSLRDEASAAQDTTLREMLALFLCAALFAVAKGVYTLRAVTRPLARLGEGASRLASGDMEARIQIASRDEFGALASQFNSMAAALKKNQERRIQGEKLASVGRLAARVAHELNNPLTVMLGHLMLQRRKAGGQLARDLLEIEQEAIRCKEIVRDLLELSHPVGAQESGPVDLRELCDHVVARQRESGQFALPRFDIQGSGTALGDASRLREVVVNLVRNAAEAAGPGGEVRIRVSSTRDAVEVAVCDSGPGIPASVRGRIFEPFFTTKSSGTGLGLAVSRAIVMAHGGEITVRDGELGGALFSVFLPRAHEGGSAHVAR